jgi:hypothetical protein
MSGKAVIALSRAFGHKLSVLQQSRTHAQPGWRILLLPFAWQGVLNIWMQIQTDVDDMCPA